MRRPILLLLAAAVLAVPAGAQDTAHVVIAATTDVHGRVTAWDYVTDRAAPGGLTRAATVVDSLRRAHPGAVLLVDAGDLLQGNPLATYFAKVRPREVSPVVDALNAIRYDAVVPGNHDFDFGLDVLARAYAGAAFSAVAANIFQLPRDTFAFAPNVVLSRGGVRVGVTGFTTPGTMLWNGERLRGRVIVRRILPLAGDAVRATRAAGADLVVAVVHGGMGGEASYDTTGVGAENVAAALAGLPDRPDVVIVGHSHGQFADSVINGVHFVQPPALAQGMGVAHVWLVRDPARAGGYRVARVRSQVVSLGSVPPSPVLVERLRPAHEEVRRWAGQPLADALGDWRAREARVRDTPLLDFINAVQRRTARTHLSAAAAFNTDGGFAGGPVRLRDVFGIYPYENTLKAVKIDGERVRRYLEHSARYFRTYVAGEPLIDGSFPGYNVDVMSGVEYQIDLTQPVGQRIRNLAYQGRAVTESDTFLLALNSYRQTGSGGYDMLAGLPVVYDRGEDIRDLLIEALRTAGTVRADDYFEPSWRLEPDEARRAAIETFSPPAPPRDTALLRVLATGDVRGALASTLLIGDRRVGGLAATKTWMDSLARDCACPVVRLDAGDALSGSSIADLFYGHPVVEAYNAMRYDGVALGERELAWTTDTVRARARGSQFAWLAANLVDTTQRAPPHWSRDWIMLERAGRRIAVIGMASTAHLDTQTPLKLPGLVFHDPAERLAAVLPQVRAQGADFVILLAHGGGRCEEECDESFRLAETLAPGTVDLVITGHGTGRVRASATGIPVVEIGRSGELAVVDLIRRAAGHLEARLRVDTVWTERVRPDPEVARVVDRYVRDADRLLSRVVAALKFALPLPDTGRVGDGPLGRLVADAFRNAARTDVAVVADAALERGLPGGTVTYGDLTATLPRGERLMRGEVDGARLLRVLERVVGPDGVAAHLSGVTVRYDPRRPAGRRVREARLLDGRQIRDRERYTLVVSDAVAAGGHGFAMFGDLRWEPAGSTDRDALARYLPRLPQPAEAPAGSRVESTR